jgi:maltose O-acetyltransferase
MGRLFRVLWRLKAWWLFGRWRLHIHGNFTAINPGKIRIGANVAINPDVFLVAAAGITVGDYVVLSARCMLIDTGLELDDPNPASARPHFGKPIIVKDGVWIGAGAIVLAGVTIGENSVIGAGSVVTRDVPPFTVVAGNPARVIKQIVPAPGNPAESS